MNGESRYENFINISRFQHGKKKDGEVKKIMEDKPDNEECRLHCCYSECSVMRVLYSPDNDDDDYEGDKDNDDDICIFN